MPKANIPCSHCGRDIVISKNKLIPKFGKQVKIRCQGSDCAQISELLIDEQFAAEFNLFSAIQKRTKTTPDLKTTIQIADRKEPAKSAYLELIGNDNRSTYQLKSGTNMIGRYSLSSDRQTIRIKTDDKSMSRVHCQIELKIVNDQLKLILKDLGSLNGTFINNKNAEDRLGEWDEVLLKNGDRLFLGDVQLKLKLR